METLKRKHDFDMAHGAQEVFRILLEALANPGRVLSLRRHAGQFAGQGRWLAPAVTLLDAETGFFWDGDRQTGEEIRFLTGAPQVALEEADFVFLSGGTAARDEALRILSRVKGGTHIDPHLSALLFIAPGKNGKETGEILALKGPGIPPEGRAIRLSAGEAAWCRAREDQGFEYPCGVELIFMREDDFILALTRKTEFLWSGASYSMKPCGPEAAGN
ncbi:MAG: phosphonate C-P lyase system protein PhnH [Spirochaetaceae bacterium]|jgi:alpha-D-ribose 1-methylphosphonate 5-triphosphate synthase subunit PhnH|nr:phosphonate C-P lyase system protein PhnH [Spirochaetaceae bacterium]